MYLMEAVSRLLPALSCVVGPGVDCWKSLAACVVA
jgi:hypothetical protein